MIRPIGRGNRWWVRGFALLGLAICSFLPFGAIGALDASFTRSVVVPHQRTNGQHQGRQAVDRSTRSDDGTTWRPGRIAGASPLHLPALRRLAGVATPSGALVLLAVLAVLYVLSGPGTRTAASTPLLARPPSRGPPSSC